MARAPGLSRAAPRLEPAVARPAMPLRGWVIKVTGNPGPIPYDALIPHGGRSIL